MDNADKARYPQLEHTRWLLAHIPTSAVTKFFIFLLIFKTGKSSLKISWVLV
jgi:hypothetical protein